MVCGFKPLCFALGFFILSGTVLVTFGVIVLSSVRYTDKIANYIKLVDDWNRKNRDIYANTNFSLFHSNVEYTFVADETSDPLNLGGSDWRQFGEFRALKYNTNNPLQISTLIFNPSELSADDPRLNLDVDLYEKLNIGMMRFKLIKIEERDNLNENECTGIGIWKSGKCHLFHKLKKLCVKVDLNKTTNNWQLDNTYGDIGCEPSGDRVNPKWSPASFEQLLVSNSTHTLPFTNLRLKLRFAKDPFIYAKNLTYREVDIEFKTSIFGQKNTYIGLSSLIFGAVIASLSTLVCGLMCTRSSWRGHLCGSLREDHLEILKLKKSKGEENWTRLLFPETSTDETKHLVSDL